MRHISPAWLSVIASLVTQSGNKYRFASSLSTTISTRSDSNSISNSNTNKPLIILCHGSFDTGPGVEAWVRSLVRANAANTMDLFRWSFPSAKPIPYFLNGGSITSVWYDRIDGVEPTHPEHIESIEDSSDRLIALIDEYLDDGVVANPDEIALGGFSMGGGIAYQAAVRWHDRIVQYNKQNNDNNGSHEHEKNGDIGNIDKKLQPLGAVFGLSSYLNHDSKVWSMLDDAANTTIHDDDDNNGPKTTTKTAISCFPPMFIAHGVDDDFILPQWGKITFDKFRQKGITNIQPFYSVPNTRHEMESDEISKLLLFLQETVLLRNRNPDNSSSSGNKENNNPTTKTSETQEF